MTKDRHKQFDASRETAWSNRVYLTNKDESFLQKRERKSIDYNLLEAKAPFPKNALIELTSACNHKCIFCMNPRMKRKPKKLDLDIFEKFATDAAELGLEEIGFYTTGEPLVSKNLKNFIKISADAGIGYIYITTNGALANIEKMKSLIDSGLNSVKFSINAGTRETYKLIHGKDDFDKVLKNIRDLKNFRDTEAKHVKLMASFVATSFSDNEVGIWKELILPHVDDAKIMGVHGQMGQSLEYLHLIESKFTTSYPEEGSAKPCHMLWDRIHLTQEGYLTLCCVDYENSLTYADLNESTLKEAWNSPIIQDMRKRHLDKNLKGTLCHNCLYGAEEPFSPLSTIGNSNTTRLNERGEKDVANRIEQLARIDSDRR
jgi:molybdenum cofactor biosynthesis enzyme MoaA